MKAEQRVGTAIIHRGDALETLKGMADQSVNCVVTSPPYWGLRDYGVKGQIGLEQSPAEYLAKMVAIFREVRRVLCKEGTMRVNMGDSYNNFDKWGGGGENTGKQTVAGDGTVPAWACRKRKESAFGLKPKDLVGMPWRLAFALQDDGWYLRCDIIWDKPNLMPQSVYDRPTKSHEYIFLLSKNERYFYDSDAITEPCSKSTLARVAQNVVAQKGSTRAVGKTNGNMKAVVRGGLNSAAISGRRYVRNKRSVWKVPTKGYLGAHFATFPPKLIEPCILAGCPAGGIVLDPFSGSGTTGEVALSHGRNFIGIELNPDYVKLANERLAATQLGFAFGKAA